MQQPKTEHCDIILLNSREKQILPLIAQGLSDKEISETLFLSHHTVRGYSQILLQKFAVGTRIELVQKAREQMLI